VAGFEYGGAMAVTTTGDGVVHTLADVQPSEIASTTPGNTLDKVSFEAKFVLVIADAGNASPVYVGPNGTAVVPLNPSSAGSGNNAGQLPIWFTDPSRVAFNDKKVSGLLFYVVWGAASERWFASREAKREEARARALRAEKESREGHPAPASSDP
jgi:hypothetical protein